MKDDFIEEQETGAKAVDPVTQSQKNRQELLWRMVRILGWSPLVMGVPTFFIVAESIPDQNHGSIADGFRRIKVFVEVMALLAMICWVAGGLLMIWASFYSLAHSLQKWWLAALIFLVGLTLILLM